MTLLLEKLRSVCERHDFLNTHVPRCICCGSEQARLVTHLTVPARWRCQICKKHFQYEPARAGRVARREKTGASKKKGSRIRVPVLAGPKNNPHQEQETAGAYKDGPPLLSS